MKIRGVNIKIPDGMDVFIYFVVRISSLIMLFKQDDKYIYINLNGRSVQVSREKRLGGEIILQIPFGFFASII